MIQPPASLSYAVGVENFISFHGTDPHTVVVDYLNTSQNFEVTEEIGPYNVGVFKVKAPGETEQMKVVAMYHRENQMWSFAIGAVDRNSYFPSWDVQILKSYSSPTSMQLRIQAPTHTSVEQLDL